MVAALVWITGASSGIGAALAASVPFEDVHVTDISRSGGAPNTDHLPADLADPAAWSAVEAHLYARLATFDGPHAVFIHNAGTIDPIGFAGEVDSQAYRDQVLLDSGAPQVLGHAFLAAVNACPAPQLDAHLILLSSGAATRPYEGWSAYCAAKAAVDQWTRVAGAEQARRGGRCRVVAVAPGVVATPMQAAVRTSEPAAFPEVQRFVDLHASGALASPEDAAAGIWGLLDRDLDNGSVVDLRTLT